MSPSTTRDDTAPRDAPDVLLAARRARTVDRVGALAGTVAVVAVAVAGLVAGVGDPVWASVAARGAFVPAGIAAAHDLVARRLPDRWVARTAVVAWAGVLVAGEPQPAVALAAVIVAGVPLLVVHVVAPRAMGYGDAKYAAALAPVLVTTAGGVTHAVASVTLWLWAACGVALALALVMRRRAVAFGPCLFAAALATSVATVVTAGGTR